jgi:TonB family protein
MKIIQKIRLGCKPATVRLCQVTVAALTLALLMAMPGRAEDDRAVKVKAPCIYPAVAKRLGIEGVVHVEAVVDAEGKVQSAKAINGNIILAPAAEDAVRKWTFEPGPGTAKVKVEVSFVAPH